MAFCTTSDEAATAPPRTTSVTAEIKRSRSLTRLRWVRARSVASATVCPPHAPADPRAYLTLSTHLVTMSIPAERVADHVSVPEPRSARGNDPSLAVGELLSR